jgi:hypothetical protein
VKVYRTLTDGRIGIVRRDTTAAEEALIRLLILIRLLPSETRQLREVTDDFRNLFIVRIVNRTTPWAVETVIYGEPSARLREFEAAFWTPDMEQLVSDGNERHVRD